MPSANRSAKLRRFPFWLAVSLAVGAILQLASCAASMTLAANADGSGSLTVDAGIPDAVAARLQSYRSTGTTAAQAPAPLFDPAAIGREASAMGLEPLRVETPSPNRLKAVFSIRSLSAVAADPELSAAGVFRTDAAGGETTLAFRLSRGNAAALSSLFPGVDPYILEALSPPALDPYPVTAAEYREMLSALLGEAAVREIDRAVVLVRIRTPGAISRSSGGASADKVFTAELRLMDLLVLENPVAFSVSWR